MDIYNLALDLGASSGRLILSKFDGEKIELTELHRFPNEPVRVNGVYYWDTFRIFLEIKEGLKKAAALCVPISSIAIDTWGVDYALLDKDGNIIGFPICYRDSRTDNAIEEVSKTIPLKDLYGKTGIQFMKFNTIFQLYSDYQIRPEIINNADCLLFMPDLFNYLLCGEKANEYTICSTGQLVDAERKILLTEFLERLGINSDIFPKMVKPGTVLGETTKEITEETNLPATKVIAVGCHDTASAVAGTPFEDESSAFLSCGTWSLFGMELDAPVINDLSFEYNYTNEGGVNDKIRFLKNINGLYIMQQLRRGWNEKHPEAEKVSFADIEAAAEKLIGSPFCVDISDDCFMAPLNMVDAIKAYCKRNNQGVPETLGELAVSVYNGLVSQYIQTIEGLEKITGKSITNINMLGGGIKDKLLCSLTAKSTGKKVIAGPTEGSVSGNIIVQLKALGAINSLEEGREIIRRSFSQNVFTP